MFSAKLILMSKRVLEEDMHLSEHGDDMDIEPLVDTRCQKSHSWIDEGIRTWKCNLDSIVDENGKTIFLEVNLTGDWAYIEDSTGLTITEAISKIIIKEMTIA